MNNKILKVHIEADDAREINVWVVADNEELMESHCQKMIDAFLAAEDWMPGCGAKMVVLTDIVPANLFRDISLINPLLLDRKDIKKIPPIFCLNDQVFELCSVQPTLPGIKILQSLSNIAFIHEAAKNSNFHLIGLCDV